MHCEHKRNNCILYQAQASYEQCHLARYSLSDSNQRPVSPDTDCFNRFISNSFKVQIHTETNPGIKTEMNNLLTILNRLRLFESQCMGDCQESAQGRSIAGECSKFPDDVQSSGK